MKKNLPLEKRVYRREMETIHDGYFADPKVAACFLDIVEKVIDNLRPAVIADLGGGTGLS